MCVFNPCVGLQELLAKVLSGNQRIYISERRDRTEKPLATNQTVDSPNLYPPALSEGQVVQYTAERAGKGWGSHMFGRRRVVLSLLSLVYILWW